MNVPSKSQPGFPKKLLVWTVFVGLLIGVLLTQAFALNERFNLDPGYAGIAALVLVPLTIFFWGLWLFFYARWRVVGGLVIVSLVGFFVLFYPNLKGDINVAGFKPRFWSRSAEFVKTESGERDSVDLKTETPDDFSQFLGPNRNAELDTIRLADSWQTPPERLWKIDLGEGWSGFSAVNGFAVTQEQRGPLECVTCYDISTHQLKWINHVQRRHEDFMAMGKVGPRATPTIHEGRVYVTGGTGVLDCLDGSTGETIWSANVLELVGIKLKSQTNSQGLNYETEENSTMSWGRAGSPLIVDDLVVVPAGGPVETDPNHGLTATLIAFDKLTGEEKWRGGSRMVSYGSPTLATIDGHRQILQVAESNAVSHDPETGEELWSHRWPGGSNSQANCSQVTVVDSHRIILSKGYQQGGELVDVRLVDGTWTTKTLAKDPRLLKTKMTNPVIFENHTYSLSDGYLECVKIGEDSLTRMWKKRGRFGNGQLLLVGDKLLVHSETGTLFLVQADPEGFQELGSIETIRGFCWNTVCLYGDLILVRSDLEAACFRLPTASQ